MKFKISRDFLLPSLKQIVICIKKKQTLEILGYVLLQLSENSLTLTSTDAESQIVATIDLCKGGTGGVSVPAHKLLAICRNIPKGAVISFNLEDDIMEVSSGGSRFRLSTLPLEEFPILESVDSDSDFTLKVGDLRRVLLKSSFCMATSDTREYLNGVKFEVSESNLRLVASDGHRMSVVDIDLDPPAKGRAQGIIPHKGVSALLRLLKGGNEVRVSISKNVFHVIKGGLELSTQMIISSYPEFNGIFTRDFRSSIKVGTHLLKDAVSRVAIMSNEKFGSLIFSFKEGCLEISTTNSMGDHSLENLDIEYSGDSFKISLNSKYILDALLKVESLHAIIEVAKDNSLCVVSDEQGSEAKFVIMCVKLK